MITSLASCQEMQRNHNPRIRVTAKQLGDRHFQINLSDRICLVTQSLLRAGKGGRKAWVKCAYFGFPTQQQAIEFTSQIRSRFPKARLEVRQAKRLTTQWEVKIAHDCIEELAWQILFQGVSTGQRLSQHIINHQWRQQLQQDAPRKVQAIASAPLQHGTSGRTLVAVGDGVLVGID
ncbi:hypothetical protein IFO70_22170 [Phormidium tenue FACHB-886]|nr:hypothetical protein [Phormidium tenue FACHB-886]